MHANEMQTFEVEHKFECVCVFVNEGECHTSKR